MPREQRNINTSLRDTGRGRGVVYDYRSVRELKPDEFLGLIKGRMYGDWITGRTNMPSSGDLIETPDGIIESLMRDEIYVERDLEITTVPTGTTFTATGVKASIDDFYNGSYVHNVDRDDVQEVIDYTGSTNTFTIKDSATWQAGDRIFFTNVNCDIVTSSFDAVGNTSNGSRKNWKFARSINRMTTAEQLLNEAVFESHCMLVPSYAGYKLIALETPGSISGTFTRPLHVQGRPAFYVDQTSLDDIYTSYTLNYAYDYGSGTYKKQVTVDKNGSSDPTNLGSSYQQACRDAESNYRLIRHYERDLNWIQDDDTAAYLMQKLIAWHTEQRLIVSFSGGFTAYGKYEIGDYVKIDYDYMLPTGVNNSSYFLIIGKVTHPHKKKVELTLLY